jgi:hypothetical protein
MTDRIGGEEVERGGEAEGDERLVEVLGAVVEVARVGERRAIAAAATATATHRQTKPNRAGIRTSQAHPSPHLY